MKQTKIIGEITTVSASIEEIQMFWKMQVQHRWNLRLR